MAGSVVVGFPAGGEVVVAVVVLVVLVVLGGPVTGVVGEQGGDRFHQGVADVAHDRPDVVLLDLILGTDSGLTVLDAICDRYPDGKVIMLTALEDTDQTMAAIRGGAVAWLPKSVHADNLVRVTRTLGVDPDAVTVGDLAAWMAVDVDGLEDTAGHDARPGRQRDGTLLPADPVAASWISLVDWTPEPLDDLGGGYLGLA